MTSSATQADPALAMELCHHCGASHPGKTHRILDSGRVLPLPCEVVCRHCGIVTGHGESEDGSPRKTVCKVCSYRRWFESVRGAI